MKENPIVANFIQSLVESSEFKWEFPLKAGIYRIKESKIPGKILPKFKLNMLITVKPFLKIVGQKSIVNGGFWKVYLNFNI